MFYIKNDDMEEMFKKAADNYELNEELAANWAQVQSILQSEEASTIITKKDEKRRKLYWLWLLLLIPAISLITYKAGFHSSVKKQNNQPISVVKKSDSKLQNKSLEKKNITGKNKAAAGLVTVMDKNAHVINDKKIVTLTKKPAAENSQLNLYRPITSTNSTSTNSNTPIILLDPTNANKAFLNSKPLPQLSVTITNNLNQPAADSNLVKINADNKVPDNNNEVDTVTKSTSKQKSKTGNYTREAFAYAGFTGNTDLSFIKFQKASLPGFGLGVTGGYHFKSGISIETGVLYDKKNYFTKGEYFNKNKLWYLQSVNLLSADGNCYMWEIPLNIKYDFNAQKKHNWFVSAGLSSYIMNKEHYNFKYEKDGVVKENAYNIYHSSQNWFSVLNVGGGINIKTGNKYFLQAQPYYKIPLSGIGKGSLSLNSAGINLSLTRRLH